MPAPRVSIRLGTDGKAQVLKDFVDIGDAGDASAKRISSAFERDSAAAEAALEKLNKTAQRLAAVSPTAGGPSNLINPITGGSYAQADGAAQASARAMQSQMAAGELSAQRLLASIDPLYAAQMRYDQALAEANTLQGQGLLVGDQYAAVQTGLKKQLDDATIIYGKQGAAIGNTRIAQMELMHVVRGSVDQYAAGAAPMQIFTMHMGMLGQAAALSGESMGAFGAFMASGWGLALTVAVVAFTPLIGKLLEGGNAVDGLVDKLKKEAEQERDNEAAHKAFAQSLDGVTDALRRNQDAIDKMAESDKSAAQRALDTADAEGKKAERIRESTLAIYKQQEAELHSALSQTFGAAGGAGAGMAVAAAADQAEKTQQLVLQAQRDIAEAANQQIAAQAQVTAEAAAKDPIEKIREHYKDLIASATKRATQEALAAKSAGDQAKAQALVTTELSKQVTALQQREAAEIKAAEARNHKGPANAGGTAIFDEQIGAFFDIANKYRGKSETGDKAVLESFFRAANENLDPEKVKWCAAFVNAVLAAGGVHGSGSLAASSFLTYGKDDTHSPQRGDIVVLRSGAGEHVGFLDSISKTGAVSVLAGNTSNRVGEATYGKNSVLAIRRPPTPSEQASLDESEASKAKSAQAAFDGQRDHLNEQLLSALAQLAVGYDAQAKIAAAQVQAEHDRAAQQIADNLAEGKYGDATSALAQSRAAELSLANDDLLKQRQAKLANDAAVHGLEQVRDANEREVKYQLEGLNYQESIARTSKDRLRLQLEIIDVEYQEKETQLKIALALATRLGHEKDAADAAAALAHLPEEKAHDQANAVHANLNPLAQFFDQLPKSMDEVNESLQKIAADGLTQFNEGLTDAIVNSKSLGDVFNNVAKQILADLVKIALQEAEMAIFKMLFGAVAGAAGGAAGGSFTPMSVDLNSADLLPASLPDHFASGTEYAPGGLAWVGEFGKELVRLPRGSKVTPSAESNRLAAANDTSRLVVINNFQMEGAVVTSDLLKEMDTRAQVATEAGASLGVSRMMDLNQRTFGRSLRR